MDKKKSTTIAMSLMAIFSLSGILVLLGDDYAKLAPVTLIIGIVFYFVTRGAEEKNGMSLKEVPKHLKDWKTDVLILMPLAMNVICYAVAKIALPEFLEHLSDRIDFLSFGSILFLLAELMIAALGEEIAWRGFFQNKLSKFVPFPLALLITAILFSICHFSADSFIVVLYDLLFIIVNAVFYGLVYKKTSNILVCTMSHFLANVFGVFGLLLMM